MMRYSFAYAFALIFLLLLSGCAVMNQGPEPETVKPVRKDVVLSEPAVKTVETKTAAPAPEPEEEEEESEQVMSFEEEEEKAKAVAKQFVMGLDGYKNQNGRNLKVLNSAKSGCEGCWIIELTFTRDLLYYPDKTEHIKMNIKLKDWKMDSYTFG